MRRLNSRVILFTIVIASLCACATPKPSIRANADASANLSAYRTYGFVADPGTNRSGYTTAITGYFKEAVTREMNARGYRHVDSNPELLVNFNADTKDRTDVRSTPSASMGMGYYRYRAGFYGAYPMYPYANEVDTVHYKVGTANVDVADAAKKQLVWEAVAEGRLTDKIMNDPRTAVSSVVTQMFEKFPGRAGGQ